jgi:hypothetical protein
LKRKNERKKGNVIDRLDFLLLKNVSESLAAALIQANGELCPFAFFVGFACHLPGFLGVFNVFSAFRAFCHFILTSRNRYRMYVHKTLSLVPPPKTKTASENASFCLFNMQNFA